MNRHQEKFHWDGTRIQIVRKFHVVPTWKTICDRNKSEHILKIISTWLATIAAVLNYWLNHSVDNIQYISLLLIYKNNFNINLYEHTFHKNIHILFSVLIACTNGKIYLMICIYNEWWSTNYLIQSVILIIWIISILEKLTLNFLHLKVRFIS